MKYQPSKIPLIVVTLLVSIAFKSLLVQGSANDGSNTRLEPRYYGLLGRLQMLINGENGNTKTSNAGVSLLARTDLRANYEVSLHGLRKPRHCADVQEAGLPTGVYTIHPMHMYPRDVFCEMDMFGGGWTVFQRRINGSVNFYREWVDYVQGFGDLSGEHWLGLESIYTLTHSAPMELLIYLEDFEGSSRFARYKSFACSCEFTGFRLDLGQYHSGNAGDSLSRHRGKKFSTKDLDQDDHTTQNCAVQYKGAWWYEKCYNTNLNGEYLRGQRTDYLGINWLKWKEKYSMKTSIMLMRPMK